MMDQMLSGCSNSRVVSKERLDEIFAVPKTATLWQQIVEHEKYKKSLELLNGQLEDITRSIPDWSIEEGKLAYEEATKYTIIDRAMVICAQQGCSFNKAVQEVEKEVLSEFEKTTPEEEEEIVKSAIAQNPMISMIKLLKIIGGGIT